MKDFAVKYKEKMLRNGGKVKDEKTLILVLYENWEFMQRILLIVLIT